MCGLLNLCLPLELRFLGTCIEDLANKDYSYLRDAELRANNSSEVSKYTNVRDAVTRSRLLTSLALLYSCNRSCSRAIFESLAEEMKAAKPDLYDLKTLEEVLLLFTMATHHPSFSFDERTELAKYRERLENVFQPQDLSVPPPVESYMLPCLPYSPYPVPFLPPCPVATDAAPCTVPLQSRTSPTARLSAVEAKPEPQRGKAVRLNLQWSDRHQSEVVRSFQEISGLSQKLSRLSVSDPSSHGSIPQLPAFIEKNEEADGMYVELTEYFNCVARLPPSYLDNELVASFFQSPQQARPAFAASVVTAPVGPMAEGVPIIPAQEDPRAGLLAFYSDTSSPSTLTVPAPGAPTLPVCHPNSPLLPGVTTSTLQASRPDPAAWPNASPLSSTPASPYESPPTSGSSSRATSPWTGSGPRLPRNWDSPVSTPAAPTTLDELLRRAPFKKHASAFKDCHTLEEILFINEDGLRKRGLSLSLSRRLLKEIASIKQQCHSNGTLSSQHGPVGAATTFSPAGGESSTTSCSSECSSPSPPPALKAVRTQSPASSGSDEGTHQANGVPKRPSGVQGVAEGSWHGGACAATPEPPRVGTQPPSVAPFRYGPPGSQTLMLEPPPHFFLMTDRASYPTHPPRGAVAPLRNMAPPSKAGSSDMAPPSVNTAVTTTTTAAYGGPVYFGPASIFPQHSFPSFLHTRPGVSHPSNGYMSSYPFMTTGGFTAPPTTVSAAYVPLGNFAAPTTALVVPLNAGPKVATCYNCGLTGHRGHECKEAGLEDGGNKPPPPAQYRLKFAWSGSTPPDQQP